METYKKSERLCNTAYKDLLFKKGNSFFCYPFRVFFLVLEKNLEKVFFKEYGPEFEGTPEKQNYIQREQNPSWPYKKISPKAYFEYPAKCLTAAPKKNFRKAHQRNYIKRIVKEAYRKNKIPFYTFLQEKEIFCLLALVYSAKNIISYKEVETRIPIAIQKLMDNIEHSDQPPLNDDKV